MTPVVSAVILAAGLSSRMGGPHKLLLEVGREPMVRCVVRATLGVSPVETVVVTGFRAAEIMAALEGLPVRFVHNTDYAEGQAGSVAAGVHALTAPCQAFMIVLGDQPLLTSMHLRLLLDGFASAPDGRSILVPCRQSQRGNPIVIAAGHIAAITDGGLNIGCRRLIDSHPDLVARIELNHDAFFTDCDTLDDYKVLQSLVRLDAR